MRIGIDLDSTLIKMTVAGKAAKKLGYDYTDLDVIDWYQSNFPEDMRQKILEMFLDPKVMCDDAEPIEGTQEKIRQWHSEGHEIVLITARGKGLEPGTIAMVNRLYPEISDINFVGFSESKIDTIVAKELDVWIDDAPHGIIDALSLHMNVIMITNSYTKYNWKIKNHPKLFHMVKTIEYITDDMLNSKAYIL